MKGLNGTKEYENSRILFEGENSEISIENQSFSNETTELQIHQEEWRNDNLDVIEFEEMKLEDNFIPSDAIEPKNIILSLTDCDSLNDDSISFSTLERENNNKDNEHIDFKTDITMEIKIEDRTLEIEHCSIARENKSEQTELSIGGNGLIDTSMEMIPNH